MALTPDTSGAKFQSLSTDEYSIPKAQVFFKGEDEDAYTLLGDSDDLTLNVTVEETERFTNESGIRTLALTIITQIDAELNMTLVQLSDLNRALALLGELTYATQAATLAHEQTITDVLFGGYIYPLDHKQVNAASVVVKDGAELVNYVIDVNYKLDAAAGYIQILTKPAGSDDDVHILYDADAVIAADKAALIGIGSKSANRGALVIRGTNEVGNRMELHLHDVQLRPNAARSYISETDIANIEIVGRVFRDSTQPAGLELGYERKIL